ncbi:hypothetical protein KIN20_010431 [Parelaphostrongylus tenuis]|uniref:Uncharacterized protein n=1 Tax=Parelaphostrongylus tenuis TaxID=148309 RepID=A0AAD5M7V6_PARTN|nr:hypothetical protein KIN20_010431 [Parelaphostrongylus tenuis]
MSIGGFFSSRKKNSVEKIVAVGVLQQHAGLSDLRQAQPTDALTISGGSSMDN